MSEIIKLAENCYVDMEKYIVIRGNNREELEPLELKLLDKLIKNSGQYLTNDQLINTCWGDSESASDDNLYEAIKTLRKKLDDKKRTIITTKRNVGYSINLPEQNFLANDNIGDVNTEFEADFKRNSEELIKKWESFQDHTIDKDLLASCTVKGKDFESLYAYFKEAVKEEDKNCVVQATGGSGKTFSLVYTCKQIMREMKDVIPVFIQMRKVDPAQSNPISSYLYNNYVNRIEYDTPSELVKQFIHNVGVFLKESKKHLLIVLDGCNECPKEALSDMDEIASLPNTIIVASSRLLDANMDDYYTIKLHSLDNKSTKKYLDKFSILSENNLYPENLRLPIFVYMYAQICKDNQDSQERLSSLINQATLINDWITSDLNKYLKSHREKNNNTQFVIEYLLPILAMNIFFMVGHEEHTSLSVDTNLYLSAIKEVIKIFEDEDFSTSILLKKNIDVSNYSTKQCIKLISDVAVSRFGFMQRDDSEENVFSWAHECYRDWFIAKGLYVTRLYSKRLSDEYVRKLITDTFRYPRVFTDYKDYPAYYVALYYAELLGRDALISINDPLYHSLIRNIVFFADDLGDSDNVVEYSNYLTIRDENPDIETSPIDKARALSGTAYSLLDIYNLEEREDGEQIVSNAFHMLEAARENTESVLGFTLDITDSNDQILDTPDKINKYIDKHIKKIEDDFKKSPLYDTDKFGEVLALYARIFGNYGGYYLFIYHKTGDENSLLCAYKTHLMGLVIKHYISKNHIPGGAMPGRTLDHAAATSYGALGTDMFRLKKYDQALALYKYSIEQFKVPDYVNMGTKIHIMRTQIANLYNNPSSDIISEIVDMGNNIAEFLKKQKLIGSLDRLATVVADLVVFCKECTISDDLETKIKGLIEHIDQVYTDLSIYDDFSNDMMSFWKAEGINKWNKYFD
ncbi:MAG: winged helix-turn-helix domain-containing protein [Lachnospiraceae bacterium]|nr:winged helix-turn-helix domain-containing protein [Lachnospiraceae bacterium]